jgi:hypothetical protein
MKQGLIRIFLWFSLFHTEKEPANAKKVNSEAVLILRAATEMFLEKLAQDSNSIVENDKRKTIQYRDVGEFPNQFPHTLIFGLAALVQSQDNLEFLTGNSCLSYALLFHLHH